MTMNVTLFQHPIFGAEFSEGSASVFLRPGTRTAKRLVLLAAFTAIFVLFPETFSMTCSAQSFDNTLMPRPAQFSPEPGTFAMRAGFSVATPHFHDDRLDAAILRMLQRLEDATGTSVGKEIHFNGRNATLLIDVQRAGEAIQSTSEDEGYSLIVTSSGIRLQASTVVGALRGMETLLQLLQTTPDGYFFPLIKIDDAPRFRWRGLMIDCGRHFEPIDVIERTLDGMAAVKLNVFHWHLSEDQGFRMESKLYPRLTGMGSDSLFYTQDQARHLVAYARARGIRVVPEFDIPGHSRSWFVGYPELASAPGPYTIRREFGIDDAAMDPTLKSTYTFLDGFIGEMAQIFSDPYMHIGGDESNGEQWKANLAIQAFMHTHSLESTDALQAYFNQRLVKILERHGKRMVGWDEILNPELPRSAVIQSWRGAKALEDAAVQGFQAILSQPYYLDGMKSAESHYLADPLPSSSTLTADQRKLVLGGEICMWAEHLDKRSIDSRIWPRSAAIAERFWSPENVTDVSDMYRRLSVASVRLEALGLTHVSHQDQALRVLARTADIDALRTFAAVLEPISFSDRYQQQHTSQLTPLTNLVDAVRPDPPSRYQSKSLAHEAIGGSASSQSARAALQQFFQDLLTASPNIQLQVDSTPMLRLAKPLADRLPALSNAGLEALHFLVDNKTAPTGWKRRNLALIEEAGDLKPLVRLTFLPALQQLVTAVRE